LMIPNGCEDFWFEGNYNRAELRSCLRLVFVGLLNDNKNLRGVLEACKLLSNMGVSYELKVVGNGPLEDILKIEAAELPVRFLGYVEDRVALRSIYQNSDVLVVPSRTESFGVVYAEAMTQGLPVIYTAGQGFDGLFSDGEVGFAVDPDDVEQIASCVLHIRDDYGKFSQRAKIRAFCFRWDHPVEKLLRLYRNALSSG
jgi:glycosyltransferase involved in cell wall biosynthesis